MASLLAFTHHCDRLRIGMAARVLWKVAGRVGVGKTQKKHMETHRFHGPLNDFFAFVPLNQSIDR